ncbi:protein dj-1beta-like isoform X2 [Phymastichus coffea]|uniref:protein dj-1beta-like isoform X2 n=1 Tax=Phymastichus coffea TaxID=108790 RepID=UPI00273B8856|nr:protein dj-1beta-like isoform X2 [Phymastichus coffea]
MTWHHYSPARRCASETQAALFSMMANKTAVCLLAEGAEEMEAIVTVDILRRAGVAVTVASITDKECIKCSRDVKICADAKIGELQNKKYDAVILPGGVGWKNLAASTKVGEILKAQEADSKVIAAICAAPNVLKAHGIAKGKKLTSYPSVKNDLTADYSYIDDQIVVTDGNLITSKGPATAYAFGLAIVEKLVDKATALKVADQLLYKDYN